MSIKANNTDIKEIEISERYKKNRRKKKTKDSIEEDIAVTASTVEEGVEAIAPVAADAYIPKKKNKFKYGCYLFFKRCFDIVFSFLASLVLLLPMLIIGLMVAIKDFGSPFYKQKRIGKKGKILKVYKFRSMKKGADNLEKMLTPEQLEEYKKEYKLEDDPRLIGYKKAGDGSRCFGAKLRRTSLDELPQIFINICILGNMSIVGPRPLLQEEIETYYTEEERNLFMSVKPGLTGYWQAYARNNATYESGERQKMELYYIQNRSFWLDIKIIFKTVVSVLKRDGAK